MNDAFEIELGIMIPIQGFLKRRKSNYFGGKMSCSFGHYKINGNLKWELINLVLLNCQFIKLVGKNKLHSD